MLHSWEMIRSWNRLSVSGFVLAVAFALSPGQSRAANAELTLRQALGSQEPLYEYSAGDLTAAVRLSASRDPGDAGTCVALIIRSGRNDADAIAPSLVQAAIQGLGPDPKPSVIGGIVQYAVTAAPTEVLDIVTAAVKASPREAAPAIVRAAAGAVPHPESMVTVNFQPRAERVAGSDKQTGRDGKSLPAPEKQLTLAEAIVQAALAADPGLSPDGLTSAVDGAISSPTTINTVVLAPVLPLVPDPGPVSP